MARRNGRSYVVKGETPKRYWEPAQGEVVFIEGTRTKLGKPYQDPDTGKTMFPLRPSVRGTTDMAAGNIKAIARVEAVANPVERFRVGDTVSFPHLNIRMQAKVAKILPGKKMRVQFPSGKRYTVGTSQAFKVSGGRIVMPRRPTANPGPSAIPTKWTPATVSRKGGQIQIRMGGR